MAAYGTYPIKRAFHEEVSHQIKRFLFEIWTHITSLSTVQRINKCETWLGVWANYVFCCM